MHGFFDTAQILDLGLRFVLNLGAMTVLVFGLYYPRHKDRQLVTTAALFNVFVFGVLSILSSVEFSLAAGFGLFAILALFTLRSEQISKVEITYFFGSVAIAVITSLKGAEIGFVLATLVLLLLGAFVLDHPRVLRSSDGIRVTLDKIDRHALSNVAQMQADLSSRLGVEVLSYRIEALDYITDMARFHVFFRKP